MAFNSFSRIDPVLKSRAPWLKGWLCPFVEETYSAELPQVLTIDLSPEPFLKIPDVMY